MHVSGAYPAARYVGGKEKKRKKEKGINPFAAKLKLKVL
jgi:hypothetical protein